MTTHAIQVAILRTADPEQLTTRVEYQKIAEPAEWETDQRPTYQVVMTLEGPVE